MIKIQAHTKGAGFRPFWFAPLGSLPHWETPVVTQRCSRLEERSQDAENQLEQILHQRSEEHTSELQSPCNLVCRLLLEKKKKITKETGKDICKQRTTTSAER